MDQDLRGGDPPTQVFDQDLSSPSENRTGDRCMRDRDMHARSPRARPPGPIRGAAAGRGAAPRGYRLEDAYRAFVVPALLRAAPQRARAYSMMPGRMERN